MFDGGWKLGLAFAACAVLVLLNGVFVAAEFAIARVRRTRLEELSGEGDAAAKHAIVVVDQVADYLTTTQVGMTAASLGIGWLGQNAFATLLLWIVPEKWIDGTVLTIAAAASAFLVVTTIHVVVGELVPKQLALRRGEAILLAVARPLQLLHHVLRPAIRIFSGLSTWLVARLGFGGVTPPALSEEELKLVLLDSHREGVLTAGEAQIIIRAFEFADMHADEIMVARERVDFLSLARPVEQNLAVACKSMHARLPLCGDGLDSVRGVVSMKDAWPLLFEERTNAAFERACRPLVKVRSDASQDAILKALQEARTQMGIVRDARDSRTLGVITLEDVLESLVGDVREARISRARHPTTR